MKEFFWGSLYQVFKKLGRAVARWCGVEDPWEHIEWVPSFKAFGAGSKRDFGWYFEGESAVEVRSLADVLGWLSECEYSSDLVFQEFWQHPRTFEEFRRGNCKDFALWAWRKVVELGYDAELVVGCCRRRTGDDSSRPAVRPGRHAWVVFRQEGVAYVLEPTVGDRTEAVSELELVRADYLPEFGVGRDRVPFAFGGLLLSMPDEGPPPAAASLR